MVVRDSKVEFLKWGRSLVFYAVTVGILSTGWLWLISSAGCQNLSTWVSATSKTYTYSHSPGGPVPYHLSSQRKEGQKEKDTTVLILWSYPAREDDICSLQSSNHGLGEIGVSVCLFPHSNICEYSYTITCHTHLLSKESNSKPHPFSAGLTPGFCVFHRISIGLPKFYPQNLVYCLLWLRTLSTEKLSFVS